VKVRMNTADVAAEVKCLRRLIGMRCSNVYDLSPKVCSFLFYKTLIPIHTNSLVTTSFEPAKQAIIVFNAYIYKFIFLIFT